MVQLERWYSDMPELDAPATDYLGDLQAKNLALAARRRSEEEQPLVAHDFEAMDAFLNSRDNDYDVSEEAA